MICIGMHFIIIIIQNVSREFSISSLFLYNPLGYYKMPYTLLTREFYYNYRLRQPSLRPNEPMLPKHTKNIQRQLTITTRPRTRYDVKRNVQKKTPSSSEKALQR